MSFTKIDINETTIAAETGKEIFEFPIDAATVSEVSSKMSGIEVTESELVVLTGGKSYVIALDHKELTRKSVGADSSPAHANPHSNH